MHHLRQQLHLSPHAIQPSKVVEQQLTWQHTFSSHAAVSAHIRPVALSQKPAQQHFSSPQAASHVIFKGWTAASSLSLCAGQQQLKDQDSMGSKVPHAQASPAAPKAAQQHVQGSSSFLHACST
jgi:hypothetical protein